MAVLQHKQFSSLVLFPDLYTDGDARRLEHALASLDRRHSNNGGLYAEAYLVPPIRNGNSQPQRALSKRKWGSKALASMQTLQLRIKSPHSLAYMRLNQEKHRLRQEPITDLYTTRIVQSLDSEGIVTLYDSNDIEIWRGIFYPAVAQESLYLNTDDGWQLAAPYSGHQPINKEVGQTSKWIWLWLLLVMVGVEYARHRYPIGRRRVLPE